MLQAQLHLYRAIKVNFLYEEKKGRMLDMDGQKTMVIEFDIASLSHKELSIDNFELKTDRIYWIHCVLTSVVEFQKIAKKLQFSPSIVKLCSQEDTSQRVIDSGDDLILQIPSIVNTSTDECNSENLIIYLKGNYCFTASQSTPPALLDILESVDKNMKFASTAGFILFLILDNIINAYSTVLQKFEELSDSVDIQIREMHEGTYSEVMEIKKQVTKIKRYVSSLRDILMRISGRKIAVISEPCRLSLCNLYTHTQTIVNETDAMRDILNSTLDLLDNTLMQKMNATMKILTAFSAFFLPLSVITGVYGMNFDWMPELHWRYGYFAVLFLMILVSTSLLLFFKKKRWF